MIQLVVLVVNSVEHCPNILEAWEGAGAKGVTILESTGAARLRSATRDDLPLMPSLCDLLASKELHHRTMFTVIEDDETLQKVIEVTERIVGDFNRPDTGLLFVVPVTRALGLHKEDRGQLPEMQ